MESYIYTYGDIRLCALLCAAVRKVVFSCVSVRNGRKTHAELVARGCK